MSEAKPILSAIRALLKFKGNATIAEIARMAEMKQRRVLDVLNTNSAFVKRTTAGKITGIDIHQPLRKHLWESGCYYHPDTYGAWSVEGHCLAIHGHPEIMSDIAEGKWIGSLGDNRQIKVIIDTPQNRANLEARGLKLWDDAMIDDRLWQESDAA